MKSFTSYRTHITGVIKDCFIIIMLFVVFNFIDFQIAAFIATVVTVILFSRRIFLDYNPGFIKGYHITYNNRELVVPKGVDVFDLSRVPTMDYLQQYLEVIRGILIPPSILIIRFGGILKLKEYDLYKLSNVVKRLQKSGIIVIISDVDKTIQDQLRLYGIENKLGSENICNNINDALAQADKKLRKNKLKKRVL